MPTDQELEKTFKLYGDNEGTLYLEMNEGVNDVTSNVRQAELIVEKLKKIFADNPERKFNCLIDLRPIRQSAHYPSPQARKIYASALDSAQLNKVGVLAPNILLQAIMKFIVYAANQKSKVKIFKNKKVALEWLKQP